MSNSAWLIKLRQIVHLVVSASLLLQSAAAPMTIAPSRLAQASAGLTQQAQASAELPQQAQAASAPRAPVPAGTPEPPPSTDLLAGTPQPSRTPETPLKVSFQSGPLPPVNPDLPQPSASQPNAAAPSSIQKDITAQALTGIPLLPGWNLISIPRVMSDTSPAAVLAPIAGQFTRVYAYDGCDTADPWKLYDPADAAASDLTAIDHRIGLWIQATAAVTLPLSGSAPPTTTIQLCTGWNLPGFPVEQSRPVRSALASIDGKYTRLFGHDLNDLNDPWEVYDVSAPDWANDLQQMQPGRGYWVLASENATLTLANQGAAPVVRLISPDDTSPQITTVTFSTDILGTVTSDLLQSWTLSYRPQGEQTRVPFATGITPVASATLGRLDPTLLLNGTYEIQLTATDHLGRSVSTSVDVVVEGQAKVGNFTISFIDLDVPVAGLPIQVIRTYDSRDKRKGDFGVGWTLSLTDVRLQENSTQGINWWGSVVLGPILSYCIEPTRDHIVTVTLPDGMIYKFRMTVAPQCQAIAPQQVVNVTYVPLPGTNATLTQLDFAEAALVIGNFPGPLQLFDQNASNLYDPNRYRLTLQDGRAFVISQQDGLQTVTDLNGNTLTFTQNGITHSAGKSVTFTRDAQGRITRIADPLGNPLTYEYDANGDLIAFTDRENNKTTFTYNAAHYLLDIHDPRGRQPIRNEYDENGRLLSHTDAFGKKIVYTHDLDARIEIVQDRNGAQQVLEYDARGNVVRETDPLGNVILRTFDSRDNRLSETVPHDPTDTSPPTTFFTYDPRDNLLSTTDPEGNLTENTYNTRDQVLTIRDPNKNLTTNTYDTKGNLTETKDPISLTKYTYDGRGNVLTITDALDGFTKFEYDAIGNLTKEIDALFHEMAYTYDANGNRLTQTRTRTTPSGVETLVTRFAYDRQGRLTETKDPDGTTTKVIYNELGRQSDRVDKLGRSTRFEYDDLGRLVKTIYPDSTTEEMTYDDEGRRLTFKDRANRVTRYLYDPLGRLVRTTFPDDTFTTNDYDAAGRLIATTDERGKKTSYEYDDAGRRRKVTDALNNVTLFAYDPNGNQISFKDPNGHTTSYEYDALNRRIKTIFPDSVSATTKYDTLGRRIEERDRGGQITRFEYDALGRLVKVIDALDQETAYTYDEVGNFITQTDANLHTTSFEYDKLGRPTRRTLPDGKFESQTYDAAGNLKTHTDFNGATITYGYEALNDWLALRHYPDGSQVSFKYTATGKRLSVTDARGATQYTYDLRDRLESLTYPDGRKLEYAYDENGNYTRLTATIGTTVLTTDYAYDDASRLDTVTDPQSRVYDYGYDDNGNRTSLAYPNSILTSYAYDQLNRLTDLGTQRVAGDVLQSYTYTLGPAGNRTRIDELGGTSREYIYDKLYRLTQETITGSSPYTNSFTYDPVGNRKTQIKTIPTGTALLGYTYDERDRLLTENATNSTWDDNGNLLTKSGEATYTWDFENRLIRVDKTDGTVITHAYDADGNRVQTRTTLAGGPTTTTNYLVDPSGPLSQVVAETNGSGGLTAYYVRGDDLLAVIRGSQTRFYHADGLGSNRRLTDESGNVTDTYTYSAFGELLNHTGTDLNTYLFAGEPLDPNSGFYYNRARWMDSRMGRFVGMDPWDPDIYDPPSLHRYTYVRNDPSNRVDPTGLYEGGLATTMTVVSINYSLILTAVKAMAVACASMAILSAATAVGSRGPCDFSKENFFFPGMETPETTAHIRDAIAIGQPADLVRTTRPDSFRNWYRSMPPCDTNKASESKKWCDEYPFASTQQGGPGASLRLVPAWEQILQGIELYAFYLACNIGSNNEIDGAYRVEPTVGITHWLCK